MIELKRYSKTGESILGLIFYNGAFECYTIELPWKDNKNNQSCIPPGDYLIKLRKEITPLTKHYRRKYPWFDYHIEITGISGRDYIYIHVGNNANDISGCIAVGETANSNHLTGGFVGHSATAYQRIYTKIRELLEKYDFINLKITEL